MECDYGGASATLESVHDVSVILVEQVKLLNQFIVYGIGSLQTCFKDHFTGKRPHPPLPILQELCYGSFWWRVQSFKLEFPIPAFGSQDDAHETFCVVFVGAPAVLEVWPKVQRLFTFYDLTVLLFKSWWGILGLK